MNQFEQLSVKDLLSLKKIGSGMESTVYRLDDTHVVKLCNDPRRSVESFARSQCFQKFYSAIDDTSLGFSLPYIVFNKLEEGIAIVVEKSIGGTPFLAHMDSWSDTKGRKMVKAYVKALLALGKAPYRAPAEDCGYEALLPGAIDWQQMISGLLEESFNKNRGFLCWHIPDLHQKLISLKAYFSILNVENPAIIHGDYCPENVLTDGKTISGIIDFGFSGLIGDCRYDLATAWRFIDMYDRFSQPYKQWFYREICTQANLQKEDLRAINAYILFYSIYSAGFYSKDYDDGHARWCVENLANNDFWGNI